MTTATPGPSFATTRTLNGRHLLAIVAAGSLISAIGLGVRSTFGVYLDPVSESLGTGRGVFSLAVAIQNLLWGLSQPVAGAVADSGRTVHRVAALHQPSDHPVLMTFPESAYLCGLVCRVAEG